MTAAPTDPRPQILIVDDDVSLTRAFQRLLEVEGFGVVVAHSGLEALVHLRERLFSVILCDLRMPFLKGGAFYKELVMQYPDQAKRIVFMTGYAPDHETKALESVSGRPLLHKPVEFKDLIATVRQVAGQG